MRAALLRSWRSLLAACALGRRGAGRLAAGRRPGERRRPGARVAPGRAGGDRGAGDPRRRALAGRSPRPGRADARDPADPAYDWSRYDQIVRGLSARGIAVVLDFYLTPAWASRSGASVAAPARRRRRPLRRRDRPPLLRARSPAPAARPLPEVRRIEVWNEPNLPGFWMPQCRRGRGGRALLVSPRHYAALLAAAYREIKAANPRATVIGGAAGPGRALADARAPRTAGRPSAASTSPAWWPTRGRRSTPGASTSTRSARPCRRSSCPRGAPSPRSIRQVDRLAPGRADPRHRDGLPHVVQPIPPLLRERGAAGRLGRRDHGRGGRGARAWGS